MVSLNGRSQPPLDDEDKSAIRKVIQSQLSAFREDDADRAFSFATPAIKSMFGTAEKFLEMVMQNYGAVYRPKKVEFKELYYHQGELNQKVLITDEDDVAFVAVYFMQKQSSGDWRINGCLLSAANE